MSPSQRPGREDSPRNSTLGPGSGPAATHGSTSSTATTVYRTALVAAAHGEGGFRSYGPATGVLATTKMHTAAAHAVPGSDARSSRTVRRTAPANQLR